MQSQLKEIYELNNSILQLAENLQDEFTRRKIDRYSLTAELFLLCFFFAKASKTASAIVRLCPDYAEDAYILVRTIYEIVVKCFYIFKEDSSDRARAYILYDHFDRKEQLQKIATWNEENDFVNKEVNEELKKEEQICETIEKDYQISKEKVMWPRKKLKKLAKNVDLLSIYFTLYWLSSLYTHTSIRSSISFVSETDKVLSFDIKPNEQLSKDVLIQSFDLFSRMVREFDVRFNLGYKEKISEVVEKFSKFMQAVANEKYK